MNLKKSEGYVIFPDGTRCGIRAAAARMGVGDEEARAAVRHVGWKYEDIKRFLFPWGQRTSRVDQLDANLVYTLGRYSKGQADHREILMQLLGLDASDELAFWRRFPDA